MEAFLLLVTWLAYAQPPSLSGAVQFEGKRVKLLVHSSSRTLNA